MLARPPPGSPPPPPDETFWQALSFLGVGAAAALEPLRFGAMRCCKMPRPMQRATSKSSQHATDKDRPKCYG